jgi:hypothetical protein
VPNGGICDALDCGLKPPVCIVPAVRFYAKVLR